MANKSPWADLLMPQMPQQYAMAPMDPMQAQLAANQPVELMEEMVQAEAAGSPMPAPMPMPRTPAVENEVPQYQKQFDDAFHNDMGLRKEELAKMKQRLADLQTNAPTGVDALNLKPLAAFADSMVGTRTAQSFDYETPQDKYNKQLEKLQAAVEKSGDSLSGDQLNYLRLKAQDEAMSMREKAAARAQAKSDRSQEFRLREKWESNPVTKASLSMDDHYRRITGVDSQTPAGQMSMVFAYMKMLDDGSVVRESEYAQAARTAGLYDRAAQYAESIKNGKRLTPQQIEEFRQSAESIMAEVREKQGQLDNDYRQLATDYGFAPERVVYGVGFKGAGNKKTAETTKEWNGKKYKLQGDNWVEVK